MSVGDGRVRILQVVASTGHPARPNGPLEVAVEQCVALRRHGHDAHLLLLGAPGAGERRPDGAGAQQLASVPTHAVARPAARWLHRHARSFDVLHVHLADRAAPAVAAAVAQRLGVGYVVQLHPGWVSLVTPDRQRTAGLRARLTRGALAAASHRWAPDDAHRDLLLAVLDRTGTPTCTPTCTVLPDRVALADPAPAPATPPRPWPLPAGRALEVYLAADPGHGALLQQVEQALADAPVATAVTGPGRLALASDAAARRITRADLVVVPAPRPAGPHTLAGLRALAAGRPVVTTTQFPQAIGLRARRAAVVVDPDPEALTRAVRSVIADPQGRADLGRRARQAAADLFDITATVPDLLSAYRQAGASELPQSVPQSVPLAVRQSVPDGPPPVPRQRTGPPAVVDLREGHRFLVDGAAVTDPRTVDELVRAFQLARAEHDLLTVLAPGALRHRWVQRAAALDVSDSVVLPADPPPAATAGLTVTMLANAHTLVLPGGAGERPAWAAAVRCGVDVVTTGGTATATAGELILSRNRRHRRRHDENRQRATVTTGP